MTKKAKGNECRCWRCGVELNDDNCRPYEHSLSGYACMCLDCEEKRYQRLATIEGSFIALYHIAAMTDTILLPIVLDGIQDTFNDDKQGWVTYISALAESGKDIKRGKRLGFADGVTSLTGLFGNDLSAKDFAERIRREKEKVAKQVGTELQRERWGGLTADIKTQEDYDELDRLYESRASSYKGQTITPQMEETLVACAEWGFKRKKLIEKGNYDGAAKLSKMINDELANECMRKKDEKPIANFTPDAWIDALTKSGLMQDGQFMALPEIEDAMIKILRGKGYDQTLDAAHQLELHIVNYAKRNADQPTVFELPQDMEIVDGLGEFAKTESAEEREAKEYGNLTPVRFEGKPNEKPKRSKK